MGTAISGVSGIFAAARYFVDRAQQTHLFSKSHNKTYSVSTVETKGPTEETWDVVTYHDVMPKQKTQMAGKQPVQPADMHLYKKVSSYKTSQDGLKKDSTVQSFNGQLIIDQVDIFPVVVDKPPSMK